jgi:hypothetical protein
MATVVAATAGIASMVGSTVMIAFTLGIVVMSRHDVPKQS